MQSIFFLTCFSKVETEKSNLLLIALMPSWLPKYHTVKGSFFKGTAGRPADNSLCMQGNSARRLKIGSKVSADIRKNS